MANLMFPEEDFFYGQDQEKKTLRVYVNDYGVKIFKRDSDVQKFPWIEIKKVVVKNKSHCMLKLKMLSGTKINFKLVRFSEVDRFFEAVKKFVNVKKSSGWLFGKRTLRIVHDDLKLAGEPTETAREDPVFAKVIQEIIDRAEKANAEALSLTKSPKEETWKFTKSPKEEPLKLIKSPNQEPLIPSPSPSPIVPSAPSPSPNLTASSDEPSPRYPMYGHLVSKWRTAPQECLGNLQAKRKFFLEAIEQERQSMESRSSPASVTTPKPPTRSEIPVRKLALSPTGYAHVCRPRALAAKFDQLFAEQNRVARPPVMMKVRRTNHRCHVEALKELFRSQPMAAYLCNHEDGFCDCGLLLD